MTIQTIQSRTAAPTLSGSHTRPAVEDGRPPALVLRFVNPIISAILRSPLHRLLSSQVMLLSVRGRRTGRWVTVPVGRHEMDSTLVVSVSGRWRHNLRGGVPVRLTVDGRERAGYAEVIDDPDEVVQIFKLLLDRLGPGGAALLGMKLNVGRLPTADEIRPVVAPRWIARVRLTDHPSTSGAQA
jgi:F420H(2)-dependent quinone reductase